MHKFLIIVSVKLHPLCVHMYEYVCTYLVIGRGCGCCSGSEVENGFAAVDVPIRAACTSINWLINKAHKEIKLI